MRQKYKEEFLVFSGLFVRTCRVVEHVPALARTMREMGATANLDVLADSYDLGNNQFALFSTYSIHTHNFSKFVTDLDEFAKKTAQLKLDYEAALKEQCLDYKGRLERELRRQKAHDNEWARLKKKYAAAFQVLVKTDLHRQGQGRFELSRPSLYVNMELLPRAGAQLVLFNKFIRAYLSIEGFEVKGSPGVKPGTRLDTWQIQEAYNWLLPLAKKVVSDFRSQRDRSRDLAAAVKTIKSRNSGLPRGSWKAISAYLKGTRRHSSRKLALEILSYHLGKSPRSMERYVYMKR